MASPPDMPTRFCRIPITNANPTTSAFDLLTETSLPISDLCPSHLYLCLPRKDCTAILHQHGTLLAVAHCPVDAPAVMHTPFELSPQLPPTVLTWTMPLASRPHTLATTHGSLARVCLQRQPLTHLPLLHSIVLQACHILDLSHDALACLPARGLAYQCLALALHNHCAADTPPTADAALRCIYDVARAWTNIAALLPPHMANTAGMLFAMPAVLEHAPRLGLVEMAAGNVMRQVVVLRTRKVLEIIDIERKCVIVPSTAAAEVVQWLCLPRTDVQVLSFADARALYTKVWWYGSRVCVQRAPGGGFVLGLPVYSALAQPPVLVASKDAVLARKPGIPLLVEEAMFVSQYALFTGGCAENMDATKWVWKDADVRALARCMDRQGLAQPRVLKGEAVAPRRVLWSLCVTRSLPAVPAAVVPNRLVANVYTSIAHKMVELARSVGRGDVIVVSEGCAVLQEMVQLSIGGDVRKVLEAGLSKVRVGLAGEGKKNLSEGAAHEELVHMVLYMCRYW